MTFVFLDAGVQILRGSPFTTAALRARLKIASDIIMSGALDEFALPSPVPSTANFFTLLLASKEAPPAAIL